MAFAARSLGAVRRFTTSALRQGGHGPAPPSVPGENLPFRINNRYRLTLVTMLYVGSGLSVPFIAVRHQLLKS